MTLSPQDAALAGILVTKGESDRAIARVLGITPKELRHHWRAASAQAHGDDLTPRQREVAALWVKDDSYEEIADALGIKTETVHQHIQHTYRKLGIRGFGPKARADLKDRWNTMKETPRPPKQPAPHAWQVSTVTDSPSVASSPRSSATASPTAASMTPYAWRSGAPNARRRRMRCVVTSSIRMQTRAASPAWWSRNTVAGAAPTTRRPRLPPRRGCTRPHPNSWRH
mgnify:CR=1 FL=1